VVLCILDGWGQRDETRDNAIRQAKTPVYDRLMAHCPHALLETSGAAVGLPDGQMGNSEVGHMNLGGGRVVLQDLPRINAAITAGELARRPALTALIERLKESGGTCHLMGLLSPGGVHSHQDHMVELARLVARAGVPVAVHGFLDGRDTPPRSAADFIATFQSAIADLPGVALQSLCGRFYAMDRDKRWDRVARAYGCLTAAQGRRAPDAARAIAASYAADIGDEFVEPCALGDYAGMADGDGLLMANFRADRAREILTALVDPDFDGFPRARRVRFAALAGMVDYSAALAGLIPALFPPERLTNTLGEVIAKAGLRQLRIAETEKYAHVTFFFNGGEEAVFEGEDRILIPSPKVATYDLQPEMSAPEVTDRLVEAITGQTYDLIVCNYANPDMVGHTGVMAAAVRAVEVIDHCLGRLVEALAQVGGAVLITADHGNIEKMADAGGAPYTAHTLSRVPVLLVGAAAHGLADGRLADVAPTLLALMGLAQPEEMTGVCLLVDQSAETKAPEAKESRATA
jgi:2,3-bisphosphoglycerate-independent phosphoglycerate mutase